MGWSRIILPVLLFLSTQYSTSFGDVQTDVCGTINKNVDPEKEFQFQDRFGMNVESVIADKGTIVNQEVTFEKKTGILTLRAVSNTVDEFVYYDYFNHQALDYDYRRSGRGKCTVDLDMKTKDMFWLVPVATSQPDKSKPTPSQPSVMDVLRLTGNSGFGKEIELQKVANPADYRNLKVKQYISCQQFVDETGKKVIAKVTHTISDDIIVASEKGTVPLKVEVIGKYADGSSKDFLKRTYNIFQYSTKFFTVPTTPDGIVCPNRVGNTEPFPDAPVYISFGQEIHFKPSERKKMVTFQTTYDASLKYVENKIFDQRSGFKNDVHLDDFQTGLSYEYDPTLGYCNVGNISDSKEFNDYIINKDGKVKIMTPEQFFNGGNIKYHYNGKKHYRGIETERWIGETTDKRIVIEWTFALQIPNTVNKYAKKENGDKKLRIPYKRMLWQDESKEAVENYFFDVDFTVPSTFPQLGICYQNNLQNIWLYLPSLKEGLVDKAATLRLAVVNLAKALNVRHTRIDQPKIIFVESKGYLNFNVLGKAPVATDLISSLPAEPSIDEAVSTLKQKIGDKSMKMTIISKETSVKSGVQLMVSPVDASTFGTPDQTTGYRSASLAGLAVGMLFLGLTGGGAGGYFLLVRGK